LSFGDGNEDDAVVCLAWGSLSVSSLRLESINRAEGWRDSDTSGLYLPFIGSPFRGLEDFAVDDIAVRNHCHNE
jgi:hypothetical protein